MSRNAKITQFFRVLPNSALHFTTAFRSSLRSPAGSSMTRSRILSNPRRIWAGEFWDRAGRFWSSGWVLAERETRLWTDLTMVLKKWRKGVSDSSDSGEMTQSTFRRSDSV